LKEGRAYFEEGTGIPVIQKGAPPQEHLDFLKQEFERREQFGEVRPAIHANWRGKKWVGVGDQLFGGDWRFFPDFLQEYIKSVLSPDWGNAEIAKPLEDRHPVMQWHDGMCRFQQSRPRDPDGTMCFVPDGCTMAYLLLAYDLYSLRHHQSLQSVVVDRLKNNDQFQGARYELFVAATCIRAGYDIEFEDESDRSRKHPEFRALHRETKQEVAVEAKSRHRQGVLGQSGDPPGGDRVRTRIGQLLNRALQKAGALPFVIFIDVNVPPTDESPFEKPWFKDVLRSIDHSGATAETDNDPFNLIVFTNHPFHYVSPGDTAPSPEAVAVFGRNPRIPVTDLSVLLEIHDAALKFGNVPQHFDEPD